MIRRYGWKKQKEDKRDFRLAPPVQNLPPLVDLRETCPPIFDQGQLGSCTANAIAFAFRFELLRQKMLDIEPSRLFIYYNERDMEGTVSEDAGAEIRDGMKSVATLGVCGELDWPYDPSKFTEKPPDECYTFGKMNLALEYWAVDKDLPHLKGCLAAGFPFVFGIEVFQSFESAVVADSGIVPMPDHGETDLGGHAVVAVGYDDSKQAFIVGNSWSDGWGLKGYFYLPYEYVMIFGSDFWSIRTVD